ncbi:hypothetical protein AK812_SmicGene34345 [Symbiodinium microadriaticum]|uniref:Uncharacterized protein n=1 Tax=Symbiodinium microadriaticum TaxID=2951 RepID=A0A1Q9CPF2_SYMMI|nr:hypothetical protein AK812_SmicGene34345 [Symbiodinium microadriaticum]
MRRLQGCSSPEEGRETCAEMIAAFHQDQQQSSQRLLPARVPAHYAAAPMNSAVPAAAGYGPNAEFTARLQALQGANRVIVRALRILSARVREEGNRRRESEETVAQLKAELEAREEQLRASERAKALLQSRVAVLLQGQDAAGMPEASFSTPPSRRPFAASAAAAALLCLGFKKDKAAGAGNRGQDFRGGRLFASPAKPIGPPRPASLRRPARSAWSGSGGEIDDVLRSGKAVAEAKALSPEAAVEALLRTAGPGAGSPPPEVVGAALKAMGVAATAENVERALRATPTSEQVAAAQQTAGTPAKRLTEQEEQEEEEEEEQKPRHRRQHRVMITVTIMIHMDMMTLMLMMIVIIVISAITLKLYTITASAGLPPDFFDAPLPGGSPRALSEEVAPEKPQQEKALVEVELFKGWITEMFHEMLVAMWLAPWMFVSFGDFVFLLGQEDEVAVADQQHRDITNFRNRMLQGDKDIITELLEERYGYVVAMVTLMGVAIVVW